MNGRAEGESPSGIDIVRSRVHPTDEEMAGLGFGQAEGMPSAEEQPALPVAEASGDHPDTHQADIQTTDDEDKGRSDETQGIRSLDDIRRLQPAAEAGPRIELLPEELIPYLPEGAHTYVDKFGIKHAEIDDLTAAGEAKTFSEALKKKTAERDKFMQELLEKKGEVLSSYEQEYFVSPLERENLDSVREHPVSDGMQSLYANTVIQSVEEMVGISIVDVKDVIDELSTQLTDKEYDELNGKIQNVRFQPKVRAQYVRDGLLDVVYDRYFTAELTALTQEADNDNKARREVAQTPRRGLWGRNRPVEVEPEPTKIDNIDLEMTLASQAHENVVAKLDDALKQLSERTMERYYMVRVQNEAFGVLTDYFDFNDEQWEDAKRGGKREVLKIFGLTRPEDGQSDPIITLYDSFGRRRDKIGSTKTLRDYGLMLSKAGQKTLEGALYMEVRQKSMDISFGDVDYAEEPPERELIVETIRYITPEAAVQLVDGMGEDWAEKGQRLPINLINMLPAGMNRVLDLVIAPGIEEYEKAIQQEFDANTPNYSRISLLGLLALEGPSN